MFYSVGRGDMSKLTSKMKSTHRLGLENRRINYLRSVVRQRSGSPVIFALFPKTFRDGFQSYIWLALVLAHTTPDCTQLAAHGSLQLIGPACSSLDPACSSWLHVVPYRGNKIVLEPKIGRRLRFISCEGKERLSMKIEIFTSAACGGGLVFRASCGIPRRVWETIEFTTWSGSAQMRTQHASAPNESRAVCVCVSRRPVFDITPWKSCHCHGLQIDELK